MFDIQELLPLEVGQDGLQLGKPIIQEQFDPRQHQFLDTQTVLHNKPYGIRGDSAAPGQLHTFQPGRLLHKLDDGPVLDKHRFGDVESDQIGPGDLSEDEVVDVVADLVGFGDD